MRRSSTLQGEIAIDRSISLVPIDTPEDLLEVAEIYIESFPEDERRPMQAMPDAMACKESCFWRIVQDDETVGMLHTWDLPSVRYIEHFAVRSDRRDNGLGARVLRKLMDSAQKPLVLEVELPGDEMAKRRVAFYERLGFHIVKRDYEQPCYDPDLPPVAMYILSSDPDLSTKATERAVEEIFRIVYRKDLSERAN